MADLDNLFCALQALKTKNEACSKTQLWKPTCNHVITAVLHINFPWVFPDFLLFSSIFPWVQMTKSIWFSLIIWKKIYCWQMGCIHSNPPDLSRRLPISAQVSRSPDSLRNLPIFFPCEPFFVGKVPQKKPDKAFAFFKSTLLRTIRTPPYYLSNLLFAEVNEWTPSPGNKAENSTLESFVSLQHGIKIHYSFSLTSQNSVLWRSGDLNFKNNFLGANHGGTILRDHLTKQISRYWKL